MRILILSTEFPPGPGGIGTHAHELAKGLHYRGWDTTVITRQDYVSKAEISAFNRDQEFTVLSLPEIRLQLFDAVNRLSTVTNQVRQIKPRLLVATGMKSVWIAAALRVAIPRISIGHGTEFGVRGYRGYLTRRAFQRMDHVVCVSNFTHSYMMQKINPSSSSVIHNGAASERFGVLKRNNLQRVRANLGFSPEDRLVLTVGNVTERKGQDIVVRAMPDILRHLPNTHYLIAGLPTKRNDLEMLAQSLGIKQHVHFLGKVSASQLVELYNVCNLFVMTSRHTKEGDFEGFGISVIEAALCRKTAVVAGGSGLEEAVDHLETGIVVPQDDPRSTSQAILTLLADEEYCDRLAQAALEKAQVSGTWSSIIQQYDELFGNLLKL